MSVWQDKTRMFFRVVASILVFTFLWQQITWAGDLIDYTIDKLNTEQTQTFAPAYLQQQQSISESLITTKQAIEDTTSTQNLTTSQTASDTTQTTSDTSITLQGPKGGGTVTTMAMTTTAPSSAPQEGAVLSVTTETGDIIHYKGDQIESIETKDSAGGKIVIKRIEGLDLVDVNNNLLNAEITYADGTIQLVANGKVSTITKPDGTILNYNNDEKISSILYPDGKTVSFSYGVVDIDGNIVTVLTDSGKASYYGVDNKLKRVAFNDGKTIEYNSGVISKITESDLSQYIFDITTNLDGTLTSTLAQYVAADGTIYRYTVDENGTLTSITVEKNGIVGTYDKDGNLINVTKDGKPITSEAIAKAQADYDAAYQIYQDKKAYTESYQVALDAASADLATKTALKNEAEANLATAIQDYNTQEALKNLRQQEYDTAYNEYLASQDSYKLAETAFNNAKLIESQVEETLITSQATLATKQSTLNEKIAARQAIEARILSLNTELASYQSQLTQAQADLTQALNQEAIAQAEYNQALADVNAKQAAYNKARQDREALEALYNSGGSSQARIDAENALSGGNPYVLSSYTYSPTQIELNQYKSFINDQFDSYNSGVWYKPADSLVTMGSGLATLKGTGANYNATFYSNQSYSRDKTIFKTNFKVSATSGNFISGLDGYTTLGRYTRVSIIVQSGKIYLQAVSGSSTYTIATLVSTAKANTDYSLEFEVTPENIKVYLWESALPKPTDPSYTYAIDSSTMTTVRPYFSLYSGTATVDYATVKSPDFKSTYDSNSRLIKDEYVNGNVSTYSYSPDKITVSDYRKYIDTPYDLSTSGLWYNTQPSSVTINNGIATLNGTGGTSLNYNATFYSNQTFQKQDNPILRSTFQATSTSGNFIAALDGYTSGGLYRRVGVIMQGGNIYIHQVYGTNISTPYYMPAAKANTNYTVEFQVTPTGNIKIYLWESSASKPGNVFYSYGMNDWSTVRPYYSLNSGSATISNVYINYMSQIRDVLSTSSEYSQITSRNQLVQNLKNAIVNGTNTVTEADLNNARLIESQALQALTDSQNTLATKQSILNEKITARQAIEAKILDLNTKIAATQLQLSQSQTDLTNALNAESIAQSEYTQARQDVSAKQSAYNTAKQDREAKQSLLNAATLDLANKTSLKDKANLALEAAIQALNAAQVLKDTRQAEYDTANLEYLNAQNVYDQALIDFNNAKNEEDVAKVTADTLLETLNALLSISSMFPQEDIVLRSANQKLEAVSILYDVERRIKQIHEIGGGVQTDTNADGLIDNITSTSGTTLYSYDLSALDNIKEISVNRDGIRRIYDKYGNIKSLSLDDATEVVYENGQVKEIHKADGTIIKNMTFKNTGDLDSALISYPDGSVAVYQDAELLQVINQSGDTIDYADGKIRHVTLQDGTVYDWSYDANGNIIILDNAKDEKRTYHEGKLVKLEELTGSKLITQYYYDTTSGNLNKSEVRQSGDVLYTYTYTYENNLTLIHDEDGNTQAYNKDKKLTYIVDSTGKEYAYTYVGKSEGYIEVYFPSGVKVRYHSDGKIVDVKKADGAVISNITFDANNNPVDFTYIKDDVTYKVVGGNITETTSKDGTVLYYDNGYIKSIAASLEEYQYYIADSKLYKDASFFQSGTANNISYYLNNDVATLQLSPATLQFGTGLDGEKHVTTDESLAAGTYNFTSLIIDAGKTLTIANGATINILNTLDVKGKILGSNINIGAYKITVESGGSIVGLDQTIVANTVNNSGLIGDLSMAPDTTFNISGYSGASTPSNAYDGNLDTYSGYYYRERGGNSYFYNGNYTYWTWTFPTPQDISSLSWKLYAYAQTWAGASENSGAWGVYITVTHSGGTSVLVNESGSGAGNWSGGYSQNNNFVTDSTSWTGVTQVQVSLYGKAKRVDAGAGGGNEDITHYLYEMKADGADISYLNSTGNAPVSKPYVYPSLGTFESNVIEVNSLTLDNMLWNQNLPAGATISVRTRTGNTATPDANWTDWSSPMTNPTGSQMTTAAAKYIQYKITMTSPDGHTTPSINLSASSPLTIGFKRAPVDSSELGNISFMTRKKDGVTYAYNTNGLLIWTEDASGVRTNYDPPDAANKIDPSKLAFDYTYTDDIKSLLPTLILNDTQKTIYMKDNIIVSELTAINNPDGSRSEYIQGSLSKIKMANGAEITSVTFDENNKVKDFTYVKDGTTYIVRDKVISEAITYTGVHTKYYPYGMQKSIEDATSKIEYDYGIASGSTYTTNSVFQNGDFDSASFYNNGNTAYLELSSDSLKYGTGVDGVKHVTANETLAAGTYNFTSLVIDAGATLAVATGATIKVLDTLDVKGKLSGSDINIGAYTITVAQGGAVVGLNQTIQANTVNNSGSLGNIVMASNTAFNYSGYGGASTYSNAYDGNLDTYSGYYYRERGGNSYFYNGNYTYWTWTFPTAQDISSLSWKLYSFAQTWAGASENSGGWGAYITVTHSGGTSVLVNEGGSGAGNWSGGYSQNNNLVENSSGWTGVTQIQVRLYGKAKRVDDGAGGGNEDVAHYLYEMKADGVDLSYVSSTGDVPVPNMSSTHPLSGTFESDVVEVDALTFDKISWSQELPTGTGVTIQTRTGNTNTPDNTWSEWSDPVSDPSGSNITSPNGKYLQYRVNLTTNDPNVSPKVTLDNSRAISLSYTKFSDSLTDPYVRVKENNVTKAYNKEGVVIWEEDILGNRTTYDPANPHETINLAPLKFDSTYTDTLKNSLPSSKLGDAQKVITIYDQGNDIPVEMVSADQSITYFDQGFATKVVDKTGVLQVQYTYDADHNIQKVEFVDARQKLEENYQKALTEIVTQKDAALAKLAQAETDARADIATKSTDIQRQIGDERVRLTQEKAKYDPNIYDLSEFDKAFRGIDDYETKLQQQTQDAYTDLDEQLAAARLRIEADASTAMQNLINKDYNKILADIVQKESSPLIYQYYRKVLGRDPGDDDLLYWTNIAKTELRPITATELIQYLENLSEYSDRVARKQNIISSLTSFFTQYFSASETEKRNTLSSLGFTPEEVSNIIQNNLTQTDVDAIFPWLTGQSLHFGDSAFETIISMLGSAGINKSFEDIGKDAIKIDILTGVITKDTKDDLLISMYAMRKAAEANGLTLYSEKITYNELKDQVSRSNVIVHIDGKHYVLVTSINDTEGTITYIDPTVGQNGQKMTLSRAEFMGTWKGYSLAKELPADPAKQLNVTQEKNIRGSGWWSDFWKGIVNFFSKILAPIGAILLFTPLAPIGAVLLGLNIVIQTISFVVRTGTLMDVVWSVVNAIGSAIGAQVLPGIFDAAGKVFSSIGQAIFAPLQGVFSAVMPIFNTLSTAVSNIATGIGQIISLGTVSAKIATSIGYNVIAQGISIGTNYLFKSMNLDPSLANIGSALLTGAIMGAISPNTNIVVEAVRYGTIAGVEEIGKATNLNPNITHLTAMMAGSLVGGALTIGDKTLTYSQLMESIAPKVLYEATYIGVTEIGNLLGVDPRISQLAGIGISSSISAGLKSQWKPEVIWDSVTGGMARGITGLAMDYASQRLGLDPFISTLAFRAISGAIEGALEYKGDIVRGIIEAATNSTYKFLTLGYDDTGDPWAQAIYISRILDFAKTISDASNPAQGLIDALTKHATSIFAQDTIESIMGRGGIVDMVTNRAVVTTDDTGRTVKRIYVDNTHKEYVDIDAVTNLPCGKRFIQKTSEGDKDVTITEIYDVSIGGSTTLKERQIIEKLADGSQKQLTFDGKGNLISTVDLDTTGKPVQKISKVSDATPISFYEDGGLRNGVIEYLEAGVKLRYQDGEIMNAGLVDGLLGTGTTSNLAYALDTYNNPLFDISDYDRAVAKQNYDLFTHEVVQELKTRQNLTDAVARDIEGRMQETGHNVIDNPQSFDTAKQNVQEATGSTGMSIQTAAELGTIIQEKTKEWGVNLSLEGGAVKTGLGFLIYFAGDFVGDTLKLGQGSAEAMSLFETGHPVKGTLSLLGDLGRAATFAQGLSAIGKALSITGGVAGAVTTESTNAFRNMFRVGERVYEYGDDVLKIPVKSPATFESLYGKIDATLNVADDAENVVYRVVAKGRNPLDMSGSVGRFNSDGTRVLYTSKDFNTAIAEASTHMPPGTEFEVYKLTTKSLGKTLTMTSELPEEQLLTRGFGDAFARTDYLRGITVPSARSGGQNLIIKYVDDVKDYVKVTEGTM